MDDFFLLLFFAFIIFVLSFIGARRSEGISMIFEGRDDPDEDYSDNPHPYIDVYKEILECRPGGALIHYGDNFFSLLRTYTNTNWKIQPFLRVIQGAIWEIVNRKYCEKDRIFILNNLLELEYEAIDFYYKSLLSKLPWGINQKHNIYNNEKIGVSNVHVINPFDPNDKNPPSRVQTIKVLLSDYREMQYNLLCYREKQKEYEKLQKEITILKKKVGI